VSQRFRPPARRALRGVAVAASVGAAAVALSGCFNFGPSPVSSYQQVETATVSFIAQGTFIEPGTLQASEAAWSGSGFVITPDGLAVTNNHVAAGAGVLTGQLGGTASGNPLLTARVLGTSECHDLAVVQLEGSGLPFLAWHEGAISNGLPVWSAGYPGDFVEGEVFTLTSGSVNKNDVPLDFNWASIDHGIEHDARIRGGNSGGPLVDEQGRVVGVNYAGQDEMDYNFAIHRDEALPIIQRIADGEYVGSIGINTAAWAAPDGSFGGVWAQSVVPGGPADSAGVKPGDLVYKLGGVSLGVDGTMKAYCDVLDTQGEQSTIPIQIYRPSTDQLLDGQINGAALQVTQEGVFGGGGGGGGGGGTTEGFTTVTDDSGAIYVTVPVEWSDVSGAAIQTEDGTTLQSVLAAPSIDQYNQSWGVPGVWVVSTQTIFDSQAILDWVSSPAASCTPIVTSQAYTDPVYTGLSTQWSCGSGTLVEAIGAQANDGSHSIGVFMQLPSEFDQTAARERILGSFQARY